MQKEIKKPAKDKQKWKRIFKSSKRRKNSFKTKDMPSRLNARKKNHRKW